MRVAVLAWSLCGLISSIALASEDQENQPWIYQMGVGRKVNEEFTRLHSKLDEIAGILPNNIETRKDDAKAWRIDLLLNECRSILNETQNDCLKYFMKLEGAVVRARTSDVPTLPPGQESNLGPDQQ